MDRNKRKWSLITLLIAVACILTIAASCKSFDFKTLLMDIKNAKVIYLMFAFLGMLCFIVFEGLALNCIVNGILNETKHSIFRKHKKNLDKQNGILYAASDIYFSAITPSASGGQPASFLFMVKDGIPGSVATVVLLVNLVLYTIALMVIGLVCVILRPGLFFYLPLFAKILIVIGYLVLVGMTVLFQLLLWKSEILHRFFELCLKILSRFHLLRNETKKRNRLKKLMDEYRICAEAIKNKYGMLIKGFLFNLLQRLSQISVSLFCFLAIGGSASKVIDLFAVQGLATIGSNSVPIPGGMGAVDYLLIQGLDTIEEVTEAANLELMSRGISFYLCTVLCGAIVFITYTVKKMKES